MHYKKHWTVIEVSFSKYFGLVIIIKRQRNLKWTILKLGNTLFCFISQKSKLHLHTSCKTLHPSISTCLFFIFQFLITFYHMYLYHTAYDHHPNAFKKVTNTILTFLQKCYTFITYYIGIYTYIQLNRYFIIIYSTKYYFTINLI